MESIRRMPDEKRRTTEGGQRTHAGFTLIELIVVIGIISFLIAITAMAVGRLLGGARESATRTTLRKIDGLLEQRIEGYGRWLQEGGQFDEMVDRKMAQLQRNPAPPDWRQYNDVRHVAEVLVRKQQFQRHLPQRFTELPDADNNGSGNGIPDPFENDPQISFNAGNHLPGTESSEVLYYTLTRTTVFGAAPVDSSEFSSSEVTDTDDDGLPEFVDSWGNPLRFYRWPTRLIKPFGITGPNDQWEWGKADDHLKRRDIAGLLMSGLAPPPSSANEADPLDIDPDDPGGSLERAVRALAAGEAEDYMVVARWIESNVHTLDTYHKPLVVSAGPDGEHGLLQPTYLEDQNRNGVLDMGEDQNENGRLDYGNLAQPGSSQGTSDPDDDLRLPGGEAKIFDRLTDNLTNRNVRAGGA